MKYQDRLQQYRINQLEFSIKPVDIIFQDTPPQTYALEFCKGPRIIKIIHEGFWLHEEEKSFRFQQEPINFRLQSDKNMVCQWSLYKVNDSRLEDYFTSLPLDINNYYQPYITALKSIFREYHKLMTNETTDIFREWQALKDKLPFECQATSTNKEKTITVHFKLKIKCEMDFYIQELKAGRIEKKPSKSSSKMLDDFPSQKSIESPTNPKKKTNGQLRVHKSKLVSFHDHTGRNEALSDILETSNEASSAINHEDRNIKLQEVSQIAQQLEQSSPTYPRKAGTFKMKDIHQEDTRKTSSLKPESRQVEQEVEIESSKLMKAVNPYDFLSDNKASVNGMQTAPNSNLSPQTSAISKKAQPNKTKLSLPKVIIIIALMIIFGTLQYTGTMNNLIQNSFFQKLRSFVQRLKQYQPQPSSKYKKGQQKGQTSVPNRNKEQQVKGSKRQQLRSSKKEVHKEKSKKKNGGVKR